MSTAMRRTSSTVRRASTVAALVASAGLIAGIAGIQTASAKTQTVVAVEGVNIRSAPDSKSDVIGGLYRGQAITSIGSSDDWTKIRFKGGTAYIFSKYLAKPGKSDTGPGEIATTGIKVTTAALNVRTGPSLDADVVDTIAEDVQVSMTSKQKAGFSEVAYGGEKRWITSMYLASSMTGLPKITGTRNATADLDIRTSSGGDDATVTEVKKGSKLSITGVTQNGRTQVIYGDAVRWVTAKYLSNQPVASPSAPSLPEATGSRYATADLLIRTTSTSDYKVITEVADGSKLSITGKTENGRAQVIYKEALRWVTAQYLSKSKQASEEETAPDTSAVEKGLQPNAIKVLHAAKEKFPQINTYYGVRPDPIPDHPSGRALDLMIPMPKSASGEALGDEVAAWAKSNQKELGIEYIIWNQRIWNVARASEGWRYMADRGGDTANHKDHIHITVFYGD